MRRSGTVTVVFTDIVSSTELLGRLGERAWDDVRRQHFSVLRAELAEHGGTEVKNTGDGLMAVFESVVDAVDCALAMQVRAGQVDAAGSRVGMRIGMSSGEAQHDHGDWFGTPVVEAARLCALAGTNESWATSVVKLLAGSETRARFVTRGEHALKGFEHPVEVFSLDQARDQLGSVFATTERHEEMGDQMVASMDVWEAMPAIQRVRAAAAAALAPLAGDVICDIGCGAGTELVRLAQLIGPTGTAIGVDPSAPFIQESQRRADAVGVDVELIARDGRDTGLPADRCDGVRIERVIQHVGDMRGFVVEAVRITRPGGRVVIVDSDWGSLMVHPGDPDFLRRTQLASEQHVMSEPWSGRQLATALHDQGLTDVERQIFAVDAGPGFLAAATVIYGRFVEARLVTGAEVDDHLARLRAAFAQGTAVVGFLMVVASGRVPEAPGRVER